MPVASRYVSALWIAFSRYVGASSTGSGGRSDRSSSETRSRSRPARIRRSSATLPAFAVPRSRRRVTGSSDRAKSLPLMLEELVDADHRELQDTVEVRARERPGLGGALDLDELALGRGDDVHVGVRDRVLRVLEVQEQLPFHEAGGHGSDLAPQRGGRDLAERVRERDVAAGDRGSARAAVRLDD